jgi:hypothetical protein
MREANIVGSADVFPEGEVDTNAPTAAHHNQKHTSDDNHLVRNREIPHLCVAGEASIIAPDIIRKSDAFG